ncbi:ribosome-binding factor A [Nitrosospira sp. Nsp14]|uniref:30S ribosome-binding factor RbfA n=1 Tax=Nitrosospira sp. Nsp14 TaxID=1855333 RepID=UPI0008E146BF|nr:30S ribosome-binding factor RbfA [Nitrosospira sp. Nsp14]SFH31135.1 ribosome-binding factor A [Nitrosospira sp. Nsp14]
MPKDFSRSLRIADQIQRELADLIRNELKDPRIGMLTLTGVEVSQDYAHAKVFYTTLRSESDNFLISNGLEHAAGFLRSQLSHRLKLRVVPQLHFVYDQSIERGVRLSQLIDEAVSREGSSSEPDES